LYDVVVKKSTFAISSPDEFLSVYGVQRAAWYCMAASELAAAARQ